MKKLNLSSSRPWIKFYKEGVKPNLHYSGSSMVGYLLDAVARFPDYHAYEYYGNTVTFRNFYEQIREVAGCLKQQGVGKDDKVTICMPNTPSAIIMFYAVNMVGAISSMVHPLSAENEIELYLNESESKYLFVLDLVYEKVRNIIDNTSVEKVIIGSVGDNLKSVKKILYKYKSRGKIPKVETTENIMTYREFLNYGYGYDGEIMVLRKPHDPAVILYSGGTSGSPKGILLSNLNFNALALQCHLMCDPSKEGDSMLSILPIFHGFGLGVCIHTTLCCGMKNILIPDFSPKNIIKEIKKHQPNFICAVPSLFETIAKSSKIGKNDLACVKCALCGGDFMSADLKEMVDKCLREHGSDAEVRVGYGLTEASSATCLTPSGGYKKGSIGIPFPDTYYKIVKTGTHEEADVMEDGEICISGPTVMIGYLNNESENAQALRIHEDGKLWLHTGDIGCMDEDGYIFFRQRLKRVIVSNGYNVYPTYIENILNSHPSILTSTVIGIPHPKKVQVAKAYIVLKEGIRPSNSLLKDIKRHCELNLAKYSMPSEYEFRNSLPKTLVGKVAYTKIEDSKDDFNETPEEMKKRLKKEKKLEKIRLKEEKKKLKFEKKMEKKRLKEIKREEKRRLKEEKKRLKELEKLEKKRLKELEKNNTLK